MGGRFRDLIIKALTKNLSSLHHWTPGEAPCRNVAALSNQNSQLFRKWESPIPVEICSITLVEILPLGSVFKVDLTLTGFVLREIQDHNRQL